VRGHPAGLAVLISLKVWELFSYQGMRAFLVFYLIEAFALGDAQAAMMFGSYAALVLATSVLGGYCADRWLGPKEPMGVGAILIMAGHSTLAAENALTGLHLVNRPVAFQIFCLALALIAVGTGLLKPNVLTMIGRLYRADDPKREFGYYGYYVGVNIGSFLAPIVCGGLASHFGWGWGFGAAAIGMALGLISFLLGRGLVRPAEGTLIAAGKSTPRARIYLLVAAAVAVAAWLVQHGLALGILLAATVAAGSGILIMRARSSEDPNDLPKVMRFFLLLPVPIFFELLFEQLSITVNLFSDRAVERSLFGIPVTAPQLLSLNSLFVLALLPLLGGLWARLARWGREPTPFAKFAIGFVFVALAFAILIVAAGSGASGARIPLLWIVTAYLAMTLGELCIAPSTFAMVGKMVPDRYAGVAMGLTLLSFSAGNFLASVLAGTVVLPKAFSVQDAKLSYGAFFAAPMVIALVFAATCRLFGQLAQGSHGRSLGARR